MAAASLGRQAALVELDPGYCDVIVERWQKSAGKTAVRAVDGRTFAELKAVAGLGTGTAIREADPGEEAI
ncbi:MAG: methylase family protein [Devosia sp.]|nr:methylase family protein [Devosia sp.]